MFDQLRESTSIAKLINEVKVSIGLKHFFKLDDIGMIDFG
jgi:hypothetical protein